MSPNDPQVQLAEDGAAAIAGGRSPSAVVGSGMVDIAGTGRLDGGIPTPPKSVPDTERDGFYHLW
jgi:hypothetical protein